MASDDAWKILNRGDSDQSSMSWEEFVTARMMAVVTAFTLGLVSAIDQAGNAVMAPLRAFGEGLRTLVGATFGESVLIIAAGARNAAYALEYGATARLGVLTYPLAVATVIGGVYVLLWAWNRVSWSPLAFLTSWRG